MRTMQLECARHTGSEKLLEVARLKQTRVEEDNMANAIPTLD